MEIEKVIKQWIAASNAFDIVSYLEFFHVDAVLDDPSVGRKFEGLGEISEYFKSYFIGYHTHTSVMSLSVSGPDTAHLEVQFKGSFPQGEIGGTFDFTFKSGKILLLQADLVY